ncbi:unnamed protein product [Candida verbasci]|uniref:Ubiquitin thioesterase OTU n=1 Tax=Candida verbasci TaxID=1227364 RepID=A0A9W4TYM6_9ASCO|nr:unnamed protein product [Candida verbasci]
MRLKLKSNKGIETITIDKETAFKQFLDNYIRKDLEEVTSIKTGFPPKPIDLNQTSGSISDKGIKDGDQLLIEYLKETSKKRKSEPESSTDNKKANFDIPQVLIPSSNSYLKLHNIPDDNSCLFNSISYAIKGPQPQELRKIVVEYIEKDPILYNDAILGRDRQDYCKWILKNESWGGAIELGILSSHFKVRIICIDIESGNFMRFETGNEEKYIMLIYSGIHYDVLTINDKGNWKLPEDKDIIKAADTLTKNLQEKDYSTNTTTFRVRCLDCYSVLVGEMGASNHANETGHLNFGEVK